MNDNENTMNNDKTDPSYPFMNFSNHIVYKLPKSDKSILEYKVSPSISVNIDFPLFGFGFQHFAHANKDKLDITDEFKNKKKVYNVVNSYNLHIDNYDYSIYESSKKYLSHEIDNNNFYSMWEIISLFNLLSNNKISTTHYGKNGDMFMLASILYRKMTSKLSKNDKFCITNKTENNSVKHYVNNKTVNVVITENGIDGDLITLSYDNNYYRNLIEQNNYINFITQLKSALSKQKSNGNLVCQLDEIYTITMNKIIYMLTEVYNEVYIIKPLTSDISTSERYVVCKGYNEKKMGKCIKCLESILSSHKKDRYIVNIFPEFNIPNSFIKVQRKCNTDIANRQLIDVNKITEFIKGENYFGDVYNKYRSEQIKQTKNWIELFFPDKSKISETNKKLSDMINKLIDINNKRVDKLNKVIV